MEGANPNPKEIKINLNELGGDPVDINLGEIQEVEGEFDKRIIHAPDDYSLDYRTTKTILDGFTEGALKNIVTLSAEKVRLYKVTEDSITLLSCSSLPQKLAEIRTQKLNVVKGPNCSVQVFGYSKEDKNKTIVLKFDFKSGALLHSQEFEFWPEPNITKIQQPDIAKPKNTKIASFVDFTLDAKDDFANPGHVEIGRKRKTQILRWIHLESIFRHKEAEVKTRFSQKTLLLREEARPNFRYIKRKFLPRFYKYRSNRPEKTLIISPIPLGFIILLVDVSRKKVLKSTSVPVLDLWDEKGIEDLLTDPLQRDPGEENQEPIGIPANQLHPPNFVDYVYLPESGSMIILGILNNLEITLRLDSLFSADFPGNFKMVKKRKVVHPSNRLIGYGDGRVLTLYSGEVRSTYLRPLAWLDPETLEETKISGFEKVGRSHLLFNQKEIRQETSVKLTQNRILMVNPISAFIYDFDRDEAIAEQTYCFQRFGAKLKNFDNFYVGSTSKEFYILRTKKNEQGEEVVDKQKLIHFNDYIPNMATERGSFGFSFLKLSNGSYLYVGSKYLVEDLRRNPIEPSPRLVSMEIDSQTLETVNFNVVLQDQLADLVVSEIQCVRDLLVFSCKIRRPQLSYQTSLVLADTKFTILHHCPESKLRNYGCVTPINSDTVASLGLDNNVIYFHKVDAKEKKLVLLKTLILVGIEIVALNLNPTRSSSFFCVTMSREEDLQVFQENPQIFEERTLLQFEMNSEYFLLLNHLKVRGISSLTSVFSLSSNKLAFIESQSVLRSCLFVIDMETAEVQLAQKAHSITSSTQFGRESGPEERFVSLELVGEKILKVVLN